jgi:uncharacterized OsmC-like protein
MKEEKIVNGINVDNLLDTIGVIEDQPEIAKFKFRAKNKWINGGHNRSTIKDFYGAGQEDTTRTETFVLEADEPVPLLGTDKGPNPVEFVLHALAACLTTSLVYHAASEEIKIDAIESKLEGDIDLRGLLGISENVRNGFENIRVTFKIKASETEEKLNALFEMAQKLSPVFDIITNKVPVSVQLES